MCSILEKCKRRDEMRPSRYFNKLYSRKNNLNAVILGSNKFCWQNVDGKNLSCFTKLVTPIPL